LTNVIITITLKIIETYGDKTVNYTSILLKNIRSNRKHYSLQEIIRYLEDLKENASLLVARMASMEILHKIETKQIIL